jgi:hypothetical protein
MDTTEVDRFFPPEYFSSSLSAELHSATVLIGGSSEQISYFCVFCNRSVLGTGKRVYYTARGPCHGSDGQSTVVPCLRQSVGGCAMAKVVSRRLCHGSGGQSAVVTLFGRSVGGCAMAQAVIRRLCRGSGSRSAVVPWLRPSVGGCAMARAVSRRPCHGSGSKASAAHRQCVWVLCWTKCQRGSVFLVLQYSRSVSFHICSILILSLILLLSEGQAVEVWEPSEEAKNFQKWGRIRKMYFPDTHENSVYRPLDYMTELV